MRARGDPFAAAGEPTKVTNGSAVEAVRTSACNSRKPFPGRTEKQRCGKNPGCEKLNLQQRCLAKDKSSPICEVNPILCKKTSTPDLPSQMNISLRGQRAAKCQVSVTNVTVADFIRFRTDFKHIAIPLRASPLLSSE